MNREQRAWSSVARASELSEAMRRAAEAGLNGGAMLFAPPEVEEDAGMARHRKVSEIAMESNRRMGGRDFDPRLAVVGSVRGFPRWATAREEADAKALRDWIEDQEEVGEVE